MSKGVTLAEFGGIVLESNPERSYQVAAQELRSLGGEYVRQGKVEKAGQAARALTECLRRVGDLQGAEEQSMHALMYFEEARSLSGIAWTEWHSGTALRQQGHYADALKHLRLSYRRALEAADSDCLVYSLAGIAETNRIQGDYHNALPQHIRVLRIFSSNGDPRGIAWAYEGIGQIQKNQGRLAESLSSYQIAESIARVSGDLRGLGWALKGVGELKSLLGEGEEGINALFVSLRIFQESGARVAQAYTQKVLGDSFLRLGRIDAAAAHYSEAATLFAGINDERGSAYVLVGLGDLHWKIGLRDEAVSMYRIASDIFKVHKLAYGRAICSRRFKRAGVNGSLGAVIRARQVGQLLREVMPEIVRASTVAGTSQGWIFDSEKL